MQWNFHFFCQAKENEIGLYYLRIVGQEGLKYADVAQQVEQLHGKE